MVKNQQNDLFEMSLNRTPPKNSNIKIIDLFAGIGGIRIGFEKYGCKVVFSSEWDKHAAEVYEKNFGEKPYGDITQINEKDIPEFDILCAGFPCQPFSQAGHQKGLADTRGTLFFDIARIVNYHRPKVVFLENVKRFKTHDKGNTFKIVKEILEDLGYSVFSEVLNAKDFGAPQNRQRIFIIGILGKANFTFPSAKSIKTKLGDILEPNPDKKYTLSDKLWSGHVNRKKLNKIKGNGFGYSLFDENSTYANTITARYYKDGAEILIAQKNKNPRKLTPREAARLQGFPEDYIIADSDTQAYKQFGNSVAVPVIDALAKEILLSIDSLKFDKNNIQKLNIEKIKKEKVQQAVKFMG